MTESEIVQTLGRIQKRGSHGVILKARDVEAVRAMVNRLEEADVPVVTLVTDIPGSNRSAYVGIDNAKAGRTAAYLMAQVLPPGKGTILTTRSQDSFQGEAERYEQFRTQFLSMRPDYSIIEVTGGAGLPGATRTRLSQALVGQSRIDAVYSMGGGNRTILDVLREEHRLPRHFIAHDLDADNFALLRDQQIGFVLHHDLQHDMRQAFRALSGHHRLIAPSGEARLSDVEIITPHNLPDDIAR